VRVLVGSVISGDAPTHSGFCVSGVREKSLSAHPTLSRCRHSSLEGVVSSRSPLTTSAGGTLGLVCWFGQQRRVDDSSLLKGVVWY
jgi:hypothetical protein